jgi:hypothetical protein
VEDNPVLNNLFAQHFSHFSIEEIVIVIIAVHAARKILPALIKEML